VGSGKKPLKGATSFSGDYRLTKGHSGRQRGISSPFLPTSLRTPPPEGDILQKRTLCPERGNPYPLALGETGGVMALREGGGGIISKSLKFKILKFDFVLFTFYFALSPLSLFFHPLHPLSP